MDSTDTLSRMRELGHVKPLLLGEFAKRAAENFRDRTAIVDLTYDVRLDYEEFALRVEALASTLEGYGVEPGELVAIHSKNSYRMMEAYFAIWRRGALPLPLNWRFTKKTIDRLFEKFDPTLVFVSNRLPDVTEGHDPELFIDMDGTDDRLLPFDDAPTADTTLPDLDASPGDEYETAAVLLTGGTTGISKGVAFSHQALLTSIVEQITLNKGFLELNRDIRNLSTSPLFHAGALLNGYLPSMYLGGTNVIIEEDRSLEERLATIEREAINYTFIVPTVMNRILRNRRLVERYDLGSLHTVFDGGEPHDPKKRREFIELLGCNVTNAAGQTESGANGGFVNYVDYLDDDPAYFDCSSVRTTMRCESRVVDDDGEPVGPGEVGELVFRGEHMMTEYWEEPDKTARKIRDGWLYTGDLVTRDEENRIKYVGRKDDKIITGGENVYAVEVEQVIDRHPKVKEAAVFGVEDEEWGEAVTAAVVLEEGESLTAEEVKAYVKGEIAGYKAPKTVWFTDAIPKSGTGKKQRYKVRDDYVRDHTGSDR